MYIKTEWNQRKCTSCTVGSKAKSQASAYIICKAADMLSFFNMLTQGPKIIQKSRSHIWKLDAIISVLRTRWPANLPIVWHCLLSAHKPIHILIRKANSNCSNYAENIRSHHTPISGLCGQASRICVCLC